MRDKINLLREFSIPLIAGVITALFWYNLSPASYSEFLNNSFLEPLSLHFITNEIFMVFFFGIAAVEITQSFLPGGDLNPVKKAVNPILATFGGVLFPVIVYFILNSLIGSYEYKNGWGIPTATDIAFSWLVARVVFGNNHPVIAFLLLLAIADDAIGLVIIAVFYTDPAHAVEPLWLILTGSGMLIAWIFRKNKIKNYWFYMILGGIPSWFGLFKAHVHPALALVFIIPFLPHPKREKKHMFEEDSHDFSTLAAFEHEWKIIVDFGLFMFGFANSGVEFSEFGIPTWLVLISLLIGKSLGIFSLSFLGEKLGFPLPDRMKKKHLLVAGMIAGIGFTVALFVAGEAFTDPVVKGAAKMGAMLSIVIVPIAVIFGKLLKIQKIH